MPWTKVAATRGAGLGGEFKFRVDLYMLSMRCLLTSSRQWTGASVLMNLGFLICEMGKYLPFSEFWRLNEGRKGCDSPVGGKKTDCHLKDFGMSGTT